MSGYNADASQPRERDEEDVLARVQREERERRYREREEFERMQTKLAWHEGALEEFALITRTYIRTVNANPGGAWFPGDVRDALRRLDENGYLGDVDVKKRVTISGELVRNMRYEVEIEIPIWEDDYNINHEDYLDEINEDADDRYDVSSDIIPD